jgi:LAO/AO transport system kinase
MRPGRTPPVVTCSALEKRGLNELWALVVESRRALEVSGELERKRRMQQVRWMWDMIEDALRRALRGDPDLAALIAQLEDAVGQGRTPPSAAALQILGCFAERAGDALKRG